MYFFRWWVAQLTKLIPVHLLEAFIEKSEAAVLEIYGDTFVLFRRRSGTAVQVAEGNLRELKHAIEAISNLPPVRLLRVPSAQVLRKTLSLPLAARRDLKMAVGYQINRETPFEQTEVYWGYRLESQGTASDRLNVSLIVVPLRVADTLAGIAQESGFSPAALEVTDHNQRPTFIWLETPNPLHYFKLPLTVRLPVAAVCGLAAILVLLPFAVQQARFFFADRTIAALEQQAHAASALNQAANRRQSALAFMGQWHRGQSALGILAETTKVLPDDSFLTSLSIQGKQVTMTGSSEGAAKLIGALAVSPTFRNPQFDSAVMESDGDGLEKFAISAQLIAGGAP